MSVKGSEIEPMKASILLKKRLIFKLAHKIIRFVFYFSILCTAAKGGALLFAASRSRVEVFK